MKKSNILLVSLLVASICAIPAANAHSIKACIAGGERLGLTKMEIKQQYNGIKFRDNFPNNNGEQCTDALDLYSGGMPSYAVFTMQPGVLSQSKEIRIGNIYNDENAKVIISNLSEAHGKLYQDNRTYGKSCVLGYTFQIKVISDKRDEISEVKVTRDELPDLYWGNSWNRFACKKN